MDDRIGRLVARFGVDRTATEEAVRFVQVWPSVARPVRCTREPWNHSADTRRTIRGTQSFFGSICVSVNGVTAVGRRRMTAAARLRAAVSGEAGGQARGQPRASAAGEVAGATLGRPQQI